MQSSGMAEGGHVTGVGFLCSPLRWLFGFIPDSVHLFRKAAFLPVCTFTPKQHLVEWDLLRASQAQGRKRGAYGAQ